MSLRKELNQAIQAVADANRSSPLEVTQAGVQAFDFIAKRGGSMIATIDAFDRLHREVYARKEPTTLDTVKTPRDLRTKLEDG